MDKRINGKDLITVGIYTAIYAVITIAVAMLGMIPIMYPMLVVIIPIVGGIPFMLFLTKVKKFGMVWIMSVLLGLIMMLSGMGYYPFIVSIISGLVTELVIKAGNYSSVKHSIVANGTFSLWIWANFLLLFLNRAQYMESRTASIGIDYVAELNALTPDWLCPVLLVICFVCGIIGGILGAKMLKKHFEKAGIA